ncbi:alpha-2-HS-glycoprotein [Salminus brasiliensis]|uniref:alpha-2-HS-glycoprotein n=1 Tax=Salminus brasiliensis TaxID=930266 RepID=UPI003B837E84
MQSLTWTFLMVQCFGAMATHVSPVPCDDKSVDKLARLAITYINEDRQTGYKFALNRIFNVHVHPQGPAGKVYYLDLDVLETKCHVLSPKSWKRCEIRPFMETQISGNCNTTILHTPDGFSYLYSYDCTLVPDTPEKLQRTCPDCPLLLSVDNTIAVSTAKTTLHKYNHQSTLPVRLTLEAVTRASHQTSPVAASFVEYTVQECSVAPTQDVLCVPANAGKGAVGFCVGAVLGANPVQKDVKVSCEIFHPQRIGISVAVGIPQQEEKSITRQEPPSAPDALKPAFQDISPGGSGLVDPVQQLIPHGPRPHPPRPHSSSESSESAEADCSSSEEFPVSVRIARPPLDFRYAALRQKRQAPAVIKPPHSPTFQAVFPSTPSPFRSCPGASRYTTV